MAQCDRLAREEQTHSGTMIPRLPEGSIRPLPSPPLSVSDGATPNPVGNVPRARSATFKGSSDRSLGELCRRSRIHVERSRSTVRIPIVCSNRMQIGDLLITSQYLTLETRRQVLSQGGIEQTKKVATTGTLSRTTQQQQQQQQQQQGSPNAAAPNMARKKNQQQQ